MSFFTLHAPTVYLNVFARPDIADSYDDYYRTDMGQHVDLLEKAVVSELLQRIPRGAMLEAGCGTGHWSSYFLEQGFNVTGIDASEAMLSIASEKKLDAQLMKADVHALPFEDEQFPVVASITMLEFVEDQDCALRELYRVLQPGGWLLLGALNARSVLALTQPRDETFRHANFMTPEELTAKLQLFGEPESRYCVHLTHDFQLIDGTPEARYIHPVFMAAAVQKIR
ncbi:class I SAM-dependent methyltransferase [uncultured Pontibacter sp.]|uniref:class I SAM-dependent methyltransferase n=1 Tax=uncultured Pontibacter sp. TaxID=453356 RepID=UPI002615521E|nr:class I SAM-dependent methyltransferase [uncultured Pontibacter sp.]